MGSTALGRGRGQCKGGLTGLREESNCDAVTKETRWTPREQWISGGPVELF